VCGICLCYLPGGLVAAKFEQVILIKENMEIFTEERYLQGMFCFLLKKESSSVRRADTGGQRM
jgi:hypothetical protein